MKQLRISKQITNREADSLDKYLTEIGKMDLISAEMEVQLAQRIQEGDVLALEKLTKANLRFVVSVAKQYQNHGLSLNDMISEGNIGLIKAARRFDEKRGFKFISYAVWWIRQSIMQALAEQPRIVRLPLNRVGSLIKMSKMSSELEQRFEREPSEEELANALDVSVEHLKNDQLLTGRQLSVDSPFQSGEEGTLLDILHDANAGQPDDQLMEESLKSDLADAFAVLTARESEVLVLYYGLNGCPAMTLDEIATRFSLTKERIRQLKERATWRLNRSAMRQKLRAYLG
ncbi:RNA polymerase sigma factor RpoD/SigA [Chryseolinea sp. T2]|uniref:sigma-70 family RNA polymerase sigma factor n=1 Tax=Chryseolinea sp. T2 TaxID=3129255 RepID=UPI003076FC5D